MTTHYDSIAEDYQKTSDHPIKKYIEAYTILKILGHLENKTALDLACGQGYYTRLIKQQGAGRVVGVDISETMIARAEKMEAQAPLGLTYYVQDVVTLGEVGQFDRVTAVYLFPYAPTQPILTQMFQTVFDNLKPGGKLVAITLNPHLIARNQPDYQRYGIEMTPVGSIRDGATIQFTIGMPQDPRNAFQLSTTFWEADTYAAISQQVGFQSLCWHPMQVSKQGLARYGRDYWQPFLNLPYGLILEGVK